MCHSRNASCLTSSWLRGEFLPVRLAAPKGAAKQDLEALALASEKVQRSLDGAEVRKIIVVPDRLVNIVT